MAEKYHKLNAVKFALACGILTAVFIAAVTIVAIYKPLWFPIWNVLIVGTYGIVGYTISWTGALLGILYGFIDGFVFTWLFATIYNKLL